MDFVCICNSAVLIINIDFNYKSISCYFLQGKFWQISVYQILFHRLTIWFESSTIAWFLEGFFFQVLAVSLCSY